MAMEIHHEKHLCSCEIQAKEQVANKVNGVRVLGNQLLVEFEYEAEHQYFNTSSKTLHSTLLYKTQENNGKATFRCDINRLKDSTFIQKVISAKLSSLKIHSQFHREVAKKIIKYARKSIHRSFYDNDRSFFTLFAKVTRTHNMYHCERCLELQAMENLMVELQRRNCGMVPATKSSVEKLLKRVRVVAVEEEDEEEEEYSRKRKMRRCVGENKTCTICLEEFGAGDGDENMSHASCMPCLHVFHEDCIQSWLDNSHYYPVCRFEMPTDSNT
ncbi:hypothetical protein FEM48_Zijuj07G0034600 [Ziziphus jujuba var. spinosa]|uniref:RING-type E3 ubiquitin transferase n=1 Tax=Ziziphus jujuba var. spinosa TaxID=714518 RepID=A0A978V269_ZIZJJ|nr:hypothetical protein FEM48_Zijuj07G0034600 [Ziziphus jujuba var. spinosa]